jgi:hypothetical protein
LEALSIIPLGSSGFDANGFIDLNADFTDASRPPWEGASGFLLHVATHSSFVSDVNHPPPRLADLDNFPRVDLEDFLRPGICILDKF